MNRLSVNLLQQINSIPNVTGSGVPVAQYSNEMKQILTNQMTSVPNSELKTISNQTTALNSLSSALQQLQTATQTLASAQTWTPINATSSNQNAFTVSASAGALVSSLGVSVTNLAQAQMLVASSTATTVATSGTFEIFAGTGTSGTALATISVTSGESINDVVTAINQDTVQTGVQAFLMGNGQLAMESTQTGSTGAFTLTDTSGNFVSSLGLSYAQQAQNASITIGGVTVTSSNNTFSNILPSVTLTALATGSGTLDISQNTSGIMSAVQNWMAAYNNVINLANKDTAYTAATASTPATAGPLSGDPNAMGALSQLPNAINSLISGSTLESLSAVGIVIDPTNGNLEFQSTSGFTVNGKNFGGSLQSGQTMFQNAIQNNLTGLENLFGVVQGTTLQTVLPTSGILGNLNNAINYFVGFGSIQGSIPSELQSLNTQTNNINQYLTQVNQTINNRISAYTSQLNALNASLQHSQSQMALINQLFGSTSSSSSSSSSGSSTSSSSGSSGA